MSYDFNMIKKPVISFAKKKQDTVVRLTNKGGFGTLPILQLANFPCSRSTEFGRLPQDVASWVSKLLDLGK